MISMSSKKVIGIVAVVVLFSAFGLLLAGEWAPSVGYMGLLRYLLVASGFVLFAFSFVGFAILLVVIAQERKGGVRADFGVTAAKLAREVVRLVVACVAYVGSGFVALAVIVAFGKADPTPVRLFKLFAVLAACIGVVVRIVSIVKSTLFPTTCLARSALRLCLWCLRSSAWSPVRFRLKLL